MKGVEPANTENPATVEARVRAKNDQYRIGSQTILIEFREMWKSF